MLRPGACAALPPLLGIDVDVVFFLVAAIIALVSKLYEKSRELRARSERQMQARDREQRLEFVRSGGEVVERKPAPREPRVAIPVRPSREAMTRPPRRTERRPEIVVPGPARTRIARPVASVERPRIDNDFVRRLRQDPRALREAILLREILGPPVAMRGFRFPRR